MKYCKGKFIFGHSAMPQNSASRSFLCHNTLEEIQVNVKDFNFIVKIGCTYLTKYIYRFLATQLIINRNHLKYCDPVLEPLF